MKIEKIKIENFRGILEAELEFDKQLNVFIGGNGAGKTTMLRAIGQCLYSIVKDFFKIDGDVNHELQSSIKDVNYQKKAYLIASIFNIEPFTKSMFVAISEGNNSEVDFDDEIDDFYTEDKYAYELNNYMESDGYSVPILKFYPEERLYTTYEQDAFDIFTRSQIETWANVYSNSNSFSKFLKWFFEHETQELRLKRNEKNFEAESKELAPLRSALQKSLKLLFRKNYLIKSDQVKRSGSNELIPILLLEDIETGISENLNDKSSGEKAIITLIADIAYNLSIAKDFSEGDDFLSSPGIVMIDEIEAHLHPNWQREIIPLLTKLFPNIQFFITTHSPQILSSVESQHVFICEDFKFSKINIKSKGLDSNSLLKYVFNSTERPKKYVELIEKFDKTIENEGEIEDLKAIIKEIDALNADDKGQDIDLLINDLNLQIEAYKFDLAHEID